MRPSTLPALAIGFLSAVVIASGQPIAAQTFSARGIPLRFVSSGDGPPLVLVSGWTQSLETWDLQIPLLEKDFRVIRYDRGPWGAQNEPVELLALIEELGLQRVFLVGHSIGGSTALRFAASHPDRVSRLVIVGPPSAPGLGPWNDDDTWAAHLRRLGVEPPDPFAIAARHGVDSLLALARSHRLFELPADNATARALLDRIWSRYDGSDLSAPPGDPVTATVTEAALRQLAVPALVVVGGEELPHFRRAAERLVGLLPRAELTVIPGGGHMIHIAQPARFGEVVRLFLLADGRAF